MMSVYDSVAKQYQKTRHPNTPFFLYIEEPTYFNMLGDLTGKSILDLGCGEGIYSRKFKKKGAGQVVAVDISEGMLTLAKEEEVKEPLGIEYILSDMQELGKVGSFDLVTAAYSLNHAQTKEQLLKICQTISINLKPEGRFVGINNNLDRAPESYKFLEKYGYHNTVTDSLEEGKPLPTLAYDLDGKTVIIDDYYLSKATYEWSFREVGFKEICWHEQSLSEAGIREFGQEFWHDWVKYPHMVGIECFK
ncbi:MAG: class I SAM-dependent methyltransferase [Moorea sp. SIO2B7]|nr:class I SAM-dependent methyltransferase [Moorena sp. SIO2B7]